MSACIYLLTFQWKSLKAVFKAHKEYRRLKSGPDKKNICSYLERIGDKACVNGIYGKWIVLQGILKGDNIFDYIVEDDFYKI